MFSLDALFCHVDDLCQKFEPQWQQQLLKRGGIQRVRTKSLCLSEILTNGQGLVGLNAFKPIPLTILIAFHENHYRNFKHFYLSQVQQQWLSAFPRLPSYQRFVEWMPSTLIHGCVYLKRCFGSCRGIGFVDATSLKVCHNRRISRHRVFKGIAERGKTSVDWFFGFKLHGCRQ